MFHFLATILNFPNLSCLGAVFELEIPLDLEQTNRRESMLKASPTVPLVQWLKQEGKEQTQNRS